MRFLYLPEGFIRSVALRSDKESVEIYLNGLSFINYYKIKIDIVFKKNANVNCKLLQM